MPKKQISAKDRIILSLDNVNADKAPILIKKLKDYVSYFKIGMYPFMALGPDIFELIHGEGGKVYFDAKFHDIPKTVARTSEALIDRGVNFFSIHASGGSKMIKSCVAASNKKAEEKGVEKPTIIGITILTSIGQKTINAELGVPGLMCDHALRLSHIAKESGLSGVVISGCEAIEVRESLGDDFIIITPAIRPTWSHMNDQLRVFTPKEAIEAGSDYLVVGRPITQAKEPVSAVKLIIDEIEEAIERNS